MSDQPASGLSMVRLSIDDVPKGMRVEYLHDFYARTRMGVEITPLVEVDAFGLNIEVQPLQGNTWVGSALMQPHRAVRTPELVSALGNDGLLLTSCTGPYGYSDRSVGELEVNPGELLLANLSQANRFLYPSHDTVWTVALDRKQVLARLPSFDPDAALKLDASRPESKLLMAYASAIKHRGVGGGALGQLAALHLADLVALALGTQGDYAEVACEGGQKAARLALVKADLERSFQDVDLNAAVVAHRHNISVRYLHVLFEQAGQTFSDFVLERRLRFAMSRLSDPRCRHLRIADIAFDAGFSDLTTFNRAFRRRFGDTPSSVRP